MLKKILGVAVVAVVLCAGQAFAHFGMLIPDADATDQDKRSVELTLSFSHPFEMQGMELEKPVEFYVVADGQDKTDLLSTLKETKVMGHMAWKTTYTPKQPGLSAFVFDPFP